MTVKIDTTARIEKVRFQPQGAFPAGDPESGYGWLYFITGSANGGMYFENDAGMRIGPFITGSTSGNTALSNSNLTLTASGTTSAAVNTRYFVDIGGMVGDSYFALPTGTAIGDQIELYLVTGSASYELIVKGITGVSINGGAIATEWSRLFINQETLKFVANSITNWEVGYDGRIPCKGRMSLSGADTTNTATVDTTPTWDNKDIDIGDICDTTNYRFNCRRAGYYKHSCGYLSSAAIAVGHYVQTFIYKNSTQVNGTLFYSPSNNGQFIGMPSAMSLCAVDDYLIMKYNTQDTNIGISGDARCFFMVEEVLP